MSRRPPQRQTNPSSCRSTHLHGTITLAGSVAVADLLVDHGADLNARDEFHDGTPLRWALADDHRRTTVAPHLVERGATVDFLDACMLGDATRVRDAIERDPGLVNALPAENDVLGSFGGPLHAAARAGQLETARLLLDSDADVNLRAASKVSGKCTPLYQAAWSGRAAVRSGPPT